MKSTQTNAEAGTAKDSRLSTLTRFYVRSQNEDGKWSRHRFGEFETLAEAEKYLTDCIRGNGLMKLDQPIKATYQIVKSVAEREVLKTWEGMVR
jgi:hypothetical protein